MHNVVPGAHNDNEEEEGKGRSANRPRERLKFQNFPTVVALLSLEQWRNAHGANRPYVGRVSNFFDGHWRRSWLLFGEAGFVFVEYSTYDKSRLL